MIIVPVTVTVTAIGERIDAITAGVTETGKGREIGRETGRETEIGMLIAMMMTVSGTGGTGGRGQGQGRVTDTAGNETPLSVELGLRLALFVKLQHGPYEMYRSLLIKTTMCA